MWHWILERTNQIYSRPGVSAFPFLSVPFPRNENASHTAFSRIFTYAKVFKHLRVSFRCDIIMRSRSQERKRDASMLICSMWDYYTFAFLGMGMHIAFPFLGTGTHLTFLFPRNGNATPLVLIKIEKRIKWKTLYNRHFWLLPKIFF